MSTTSVAEITSLEQLYAVLPEHHFEPLWTMKGVLTPQPVTNMVPYLWPYREARELIERSGNLITAEEADRRVIAMRNPGTQPYEVARATDTLWAALQMVLPGEIAPPHRHSAAALRYIIEGSGAYSIVNGRRCMMEPGDFVSTPPYNWHEHGHEGVGPMIWLDALDAPMVHTIHQIFADFGPSPMDSLPIAGAALRSSELKPAWDNAPDAPTYIWKLADVEAALAELRDEQGSPYDDLILEYRDPSTNGPVLRTLSASMQLLRPGVETKSHQHTPSTVYHVARGSGFSTIGGQRFDWQTGDTFAVPVWAPHAHANPGSEDALLFSFSDEPAIRALGLYREQDAGV